MLDLQKKMYEMYAKGKCPRKKSRIEDFILTYMFIQIPCKS